MDMNKIWKLKGKNINIVSVKHFSIGELALVTDVRAKAGTDIKFQVEFHNTGETHWFNGSDIMNGKLVIEVQ